MIPLPRNVANCITKDVISGIQFEDVFFQQLLCSPNVILNATNFVGEKKFQRSSSFNILKCYKILLFRTKIMFYCDISRDTHDLISFLNAHLSNYLFSTLPRITVDQQISRRLFYAPHLPTKHVHMTREIKSKHTWIVHS